MTNTTQKTVFGHIPTTTRPHASRDGVQHLFEFWNGFGASVIRGSGTYGATQGLWELAVFGQDGKITYSTPITSNVVGFLSETEVRRVLNRIQALEA